MVPTLEWAAGADKVTVQPRIMGAEDFALFQERIPGFYFRLGVNEEGVEASQAAPNHSPLFFANEDALVVGVRAMAGVAWDYLHGE
jgi:amidohydrolase